MKRPISNGTPREENSSVKNGKGRLILVVDDERPVCIMLSMMLKASGYEVIQAFNGAEALTAFQQRSEDIELVITDIMMPVMDGVALTRALRDISPETRIIASTGRPDPAIEKELRELGVRALLVKPFKRDTLLEAVTLALNDATWTYQRLTG